MKRHLKDSRTSECVLDQAQVSLRRTVVGSRTGDTRGESWKAVLGRIPEERIEQHIVIGHVEARMVKQVERVEIVAQSVALADFEILEDAEIETILEWRAEGVASSIGVAIFEVIASQGAAAGVTRRHSVASWCKDRGYPEGIDVQNRVVCVDSSRTLQNRLGCGRSNSADRDDRVGNRILPAAPKDAGCSSAEVIDAVRLAAFQYGHSSQTPPIHHLPRESMGGGDSGKLIVIAHGKYMGAVEVRVAI